MLRCRETRYIESFVELSPSTMKMELISESQVGLKSNFVLATSLDVSLYIGEERMGDAFVPHNELFGYYSLSDD